MPKLLLISSFLFASACATYSPPHAWSELSDEVFKNPGDYVNKDVVVCGLVHDRFEDRNIWQRKPTPRAAVIGIGFIASRQRDENSKYDGRMACIQGTIVETSCDHEMICTWSRYRYALRESNLSKVAPLPDHP